MNATASAGSILDARSAGRHAAGAELVWDRLTSGRVAALDALRGLACGIVILDHLEMAGPLAGVGLPVFLLLSGFLITGMLLRESDRTGTISTRGFLARRAMRLMPGLYAYLCFATVLLLSGGVRVNWSHLGAAALHLGNYYEAVAGPQESYVSHPWSLGLQEQFYLVWPLVLLWLRNDLDKRREHASILDPSDGPLAADLLVVHGRGRRRVWGRKGR
ncbi:MAG: acyltransferase [Deltaproteobacteria bacterium]|nr:acyltransferase [Deltaproteobacteria bacterium]